ncbi:MAG: DNA gyrase subunit A, partial [Acidimicrobiia bacterium]|nr:DNA gyrase subunit A [Acidimicrobiia bacterium]
FSRKGRGGLGVRGIKHVAERGDVAGALMVSEDAEVFLIGSDGVVIRMPVAEISIQGRDATGVRVMNLKSGSTVAALALVTQADEDGDTEATGVDAEPGSDPGDTSAD